MSIEEQRDRLENINYQNKKKTNRGLCAIISLGFTTFLLKIGLVIQTIFSIIAKNKLITALFVTLVTSTASNVYLGLENYNLQNDLSECRERINLTHRSTLSSDMTSESTWKPMNESTTTTTVTSPEGYSTTLTIEEGTKPDLSSTSTLSTTEEDLTVISEDVSRLDSSSTSMTITTPFNVITSNDEDMTNPDVSTTFMPITTTSNDFQPDIILNPAVD